MKKLFTLLVIFTFFVSALSVAQIQKKEDNRKMDLKKSDLIQDNTKTPLNLNTSGNNIFPNNPMTPDAVAPYTFAQTTGTYTAIAGTTIIAASTDDASSTIQNIGFNFTYNGLVFTTFGANSNGYITLGAVPLGYYTPLSAEPNCIAFAGGDGRTGGVVTYLLTGTSPNQVLTIQFPTWNIHYGSASDYVDAQIKLYETTNVVEIIYGGSARASSYTRQVGITGAATSDYSIRILGTSWAATVAGAANSATMTWSTSYYPASGQIYRWTPPVVGAPTLTVVPSSLSFGYVAFPGTSVTQSYVLSGTNLTAGPIVITPPAGFEVSLDGTTWSSSVNVTYTPPSLANTTIYTHFKPLAASTAYSGNITNIGGGATTPVAVTGSSILTYCAASSSMCDEYISNVTVGTINNSSACSNYADYTAQSTNMNIGVGYAITITNGIPYSGDQCGIWVDWNHDGDFADANETIYTGTGYTATVTPPAGAYIGSTRMRIRIMWTGTLDPCGTASYGEVEDYTINVAEAPPEPVFSITPNSKAFGNTSLGGGTVDQTFTITNTGGSTLTINSSDFTLTGSDPTQFQIIGANTLNLTSGQTGTVGVQFAPTTLGSKTANLLIVDNIPSSHDIALTGTGVLNAPQSLVGGLNTGFKPSLTWQAPVPGSEIKIDDGTVEQNMWVGSPSTTTQLFFNKMVSPHNGTISQIGIYSYSTTAGNLFNSVMLCPDDGSGKPNIGAPYATFSNVAVGTSPAWIFLTLSSPQAVTAGQTFYIVTQWPAGSTTGPYIGADNTTSNGRSYWTQDGGTTWNAWAANWLMRAYMGTYSDKLISGESPSEMKLIKPTSIKASIKKTDITERKRIEKQFSVPAAFIYGSTGEKVLSSYTVRRGATSGNYTTEFTGISALTYDDNSAVLGNTYYYVVDAVYTEGTSSHSNEVVVTALNPNYGIFSLNLSGDLYKFSNNTNYGNPGTNEKPTYEWIPTTDFTPITFSSNDDGSTLVDFSGQFFRFFDTDYSSVYVGTNGYLTFGGPATDWSPAGALPNASDPTNMIAAAFMDLYVRTEYALATNISYKIFTDKIVISYENIYHVSASNGQNFISFQIILYASALIPSTNSLYVINYNDEMSYTPFASNSIVTGASVGANGPAGEYGYNYRFAGTKGPMFSGVSLDPKGANALSLGFVDFNAPLPVTLSSFTSLMKGRNVNLTWKTEKEINNAGFDVERKLFGSSEWVKTGFVKGNGSSNSPANYSFEDKKLNCGKYNYRLKQIDYNGNFEYHNLTTVVDVALPTKFSLSQNYPNPFNPTTKIDFDLPFDSKVNIVLYDMTGREVKTLVNEGKTAGYHTVQFNASDLSSGVYFYRIMTKSVDKEFTATKKMMLVK